MECRCPACGKQLGEDNPCPRCGCDLTLPRAADKAASREYREALRHLTEGNGGAAGEPAERSWRRRHTREAARVLFLAEVLRGDHRAASTWFKRARPPAVES